MQTTTPLAAIIFDFDGTLADTFPLVIDSWNTAMRAAIGVTHPPEDVIARFGIPEVRMFQREFAGRPDAVWQKAMDNYLAAYEEGHEIVQPFEGIPEMLHRFREAGIPTGVMTSKGRHACDISLRRLGWDGAFASVVTGDEVAEQKPDPEGPLLVASELGVLPSRCAFVGDSAADIEAGRAAGMRTVAAAWHTVYTDALRAARPDHWARTPAELPVLFGLAAPA